MQYHENVWTIADFLTPTACDELIAFSEAQGYEEAKVGAGEGIMFKGIRDNYRILYQNWDWAAEFWAKLRLHCPAEIAGWKAKGLNEQFRFYKYELYQRFKKHRDGRFRRNEEEESKITFMVYLNDDFEGGETAFEGFSIKPQKGMALCFIHEEKHEGCPVVSGVKYVLRSDVMYQKKPC